MRTVICVYRVSDEGGPPVCAEMLTVRLAGATVRCSVAGPHRHAAARRAAAPRAAAPRAAAPRAAAVASPSVALCVCVCV